MAAVAAPAPDRLAGNPELVEYCPTCAVTVVPLENGKCGWCSHQLRRPKRAAPPKKKAAKPKKRKPAPPPTPPLMDELDDVTERVTAEVSALAKVIAADGDAYAKKYAAWWVRGGNGVGPSPPPALRGPAAHMVRELVRDEATAVRLYGTRRRAA